MENTIACCGLNCAACDARIATLHNDDTLRAQTAEKWKVMYNAPGITPEMINCTGCREPGVKINHWAECQIRLCATAKGYQTCGECGELEKCDLIGPVFQFVPEAKDNLKI
ncbi:MAG TPA: DUF3795 domain-containing protein [Bacteroidales bacterium]|nr:DUF3795 domain-containing protein [Bacteroidales bacterium]